ncbi:heat shock protein HtrA [Clostridium sp. CAG:448]|nr:heat shock protein HtrA [Clostridium sp. CAG:448]
MSQLVKCPNCGGELVDYNGSRLCTFCDCSFTPDGKRNTIVATKKSANSPAEIGVDVYEKNISGVIEIRWHNSKVACSGSGFIVNSSGYAVTNTHVVTDNCAAVNTLEVNDRRRIYHNRTRCGAW